MLDTPRSQTNTSPSAEARKVDSRRIELDRIVPFVRGLMAALHDAGEDVWLTGQHLRDLISGESPAAPRLLLRLRQRMVLWMLIMRPSTIPRRRRPLASCSRGVGKFSVKSAH